jgi:hypothetical protein
MPPSAIEFDSDRVKADIVKQIREPPRALFNRHVEEVQRAVVLAERNMDQGDLVRRNVPGLRELAELRQYLSSGVIFVRGAICVSERGQHHGT